MENKMETGLRLIRLYSQDDYTESGILYRIYWSQVRDLCVKYLRNLTEAEDLAQEILLNVIVRKEIFKFQGQPQLWPWLHGVTVNACKNHIHKINNQRNLETDGLGVEPELMMISPMSENDAKHGEISARVLQVLKNLIDEN